MRVAGDDTAVTPCLNVLLTFWLWFLEMVVRLAKQLILHPIEVGHTETQRGSFTALRGLCCFLDHHIALLTFHGSSKGLQEPGPKLGLYLLLGVAEDDSLCDGEGVVEVAERVELPLLLLHCHKELLDALATAQHTSQTQPPVNPSAR